MNAQEQIHYDKHSRHFHMSECNITECKRAAADERSYASLADELNDGGVTMTIDDFDKKFVKEAKRYADQNDLPWPPGIGDFDRYYERKQSS